MFKRLLSVSLIVLLALPLNAGAAIWMAMSMEESDEVSEMLESSESPHHEQHMSMGSDHSLDSDSNHEHDCDEHCMSCASHCYSSSITSAIADFQNQRSLHASAVSGVTLSREYLFFRPPIHA